MIQSFYAFDQKICSMGIEPGSLRSNYMKPTVSAQSCSLNLRKLTATDLLPHIRSLFGHCDTSSIVFRRFQFPFSLWRSQREEIWGEIFYYKKFGALNTQSKRK